jgi:hypothetical protein
VRRGRATVLGIVALALAGSACGPRGAKEDTGLSSDPGVVLEARVTPTPYRTGTALVAVTLTDAKSRNPLSGAVVKLEGNMTHPGMVPVQATAQEKLPGVYEAPIELGMAGDWTLEIDATLKDGRSAHRQLELPHVTAPG